MDGTIINSFKAGLQALLDSLQAVHSIYQDHVTIVPCHHSKVVFCVKEVHIICQDSVFTLILTVTVGVVRSDKLGRAHSRETNTTKH